MPCLSPATLRMWLSCTWVDLSQAAATCTATNFALCPSFSCGASLLDDVQVDGFDSTDQFDNAELSTFPSDLGLDRDFAAALNFTIRQLNS